MATTPAPDYGKLVPREISGLQNPERFYNATKKTFDVAKAKGAYITENLGLDNSILKGDVAKAKFAKQVKDLGVDYTKFRFDANGVKDANEAKKYKDLGLANPERYSSAKGYNSIEAQKAVVKDVYGLNPDTYGGVAKGKPYQKRDASGKLVFINGRPVMVTPQVKTFDFTQATNEYQYNLPKITNLGDRPTNFIQAAQQYQSAVNQAIAAGADNLNATDRETLRKAGAAVRLHRGQATGGSAQALLDSINQAEDALNALDTAKARRDLSRTELGKPGGKTEANKGLLRNDERAVLDAVMAIRYGAPRLAEAVDLLDFNDVKLSDIGAAAGLTSSAPGGATGTAGAAANLGSSAGSGPATSPTSPTSPAGLAGTVGTLSSANIFGTPQPVGKNAPADEVDAAILREYNTLTDKAITDSNTAIAAANNQKADLQAKLALATPGTPNHTSLASQISQIDTDLASLNDTLTKATALKTKGFTVTDNDRAQYRKIISLSEENALDAIGKIDPQYLGGARALSSQYRSMVDTPLGPTQDDRTEALRGLIEDEAMNQLRLGSTLDESVRREVQQAARGAQTARGNIFGVAPAVEEAMQTGLMGEQRKAQRYGAAAAFLGSGMTRGDQAARNTSMRQALDLSRLGAANEFLAGGANPYNISRQYVADKNAAFNNYIAANVGQAGGFNTTNYQTNPFMFVNPNAGLEGAQTSASIYNQMQASQASMYGSQVGAIANTYTSPFQAFSQVAGGIGSLFSPFKFS